MTGGKGNDIIVFESFAESVGCEGPGLLDCGLTYSENLDLHAFWCTYIISIDLLGKIALSRFLAATVKSVKLTAHNPGPLVMTHMCTFRLMISASSRDSELDQ